MILVCAQELHGLVSTANDRALKREIRRAPISDKVSVASSLGYPGDMSMDVLDNILLRHAKQTRTATAISGPASAPPGAVKAALANSALANESKHIETNLRAALRDAQSRLKAMAEERDDFAVELEQCRGERDRFRAEALKRTAPTNRSTRATPESSLIEALGDKVSGLEQERIVLHARVNNSARRNEKLEQQVSREPHSVCLCSASRWFELPATRVARASRCSTTERLSRTGCGAGARSCTRAAGSAVHPRARLQRQRRAMGSTLLSGRRATWPDLSTDAAGQLPRARPPTCMCQAVGCLLTSPRPPCTSPTPPHLCAFASMEGRCAAADSFSRRRFRSRRRARSWMTSLSPTARLSG